MPASCWLPHLADQYCVQNDLSALYAAHLKRTAARLSLWWGVRVRAGGPNADELTEPLVSEFVQYWSTQVGPWTAKGMRQHVLCLWNYAASLGLCQPPHGRWIRKPKLPEPLPEVWTDEQWRDLLQGIRFLEGAIRNQGFARSDYWSAAVRFAFDATLRRSDVLAATMDRLHHDGSGHVWQPKVQAWKAVSLSAATMTAILELPRRDNRVIPWKSQPENFSRAFGRVLRELNLPGSFGWIRTTAATMVEREHPGLGPVALGHTTARCLPHYVPKSVRQPAVRPTMTV